MKKVSLSSASAFFAIAPDAIPTGTIALEDTSLLQSTSSAI